MGWLASGIVYSIAYAIVGSLLRDQAAVLSWFRAAALLVPPLTGATVIVLRRQRWSGCQWLFWSTIALGLAMSAIGLTGWAADELITRKETWLAWKGEILLAAGKTLEARAVLSATLKTIDGLPPRMRTAPGVTELRARVERFLASLPVSVAADQKTD